MGGESSSITDGVYGTLDIESLEKIFRALATCGLSRGELFLDLGFGLGT